jgi:ABC-type amino acid transport substrate-binding protein
VDFALGGLVHTKAATAHADFGLTYLYDGEALLVRTGTYADFQSLARRNITYIDTPSTFALRDAQIASNITVTLQSAPSYDAAIRQLRDAQTDAVIGRWRRLRTESGRDPALTVLTVFQREPVAMMLPRNNSDWSTLVNITFSALIADGTFAKVYKKWFNQLPEPVYPLPNAIDIQLAGLPDKIALHDTLSRVRNSTSVKIGFIAQADPLATLDANGEAVGFEVDICRELARRWFQNANAADFTSVPAGDVAGLLRSNSIDMAIGGIAQTQTNARVMDFSSITYQGGVGIAVLATSTANDLSTLNGKVVGAIRGKTDAALLEATIKARNISIISRPYSDLTAVFDALRNGQVDAVLGEQSTLIALARTAKDIRVLPERLNNLPVGIALARDDSTFKAFVNLTLQDIFADGTYALLYKKWFNTTPPDMELWPGGATLNTGLIAPTAIALPTATPVFGALDTPAPGQIPPTPVPPSTPTPQK